MPSDLSGTPTSLGIGTYNTSTDAPSGLGFNEAMAQIDALIVGVKGDVAAFPKVTTSALSAGPPASPVDKDIWIATDVNGNGDGTRWQFQYNAGSASPYKWEFIGGPDMRGFDDATHAASASPSFTYSALAAPTITVPRAGEYDVSSSGLVWVGGSAGSTVYYSYMVNGSAASALNVHGFHAYVAAAAEGDAQSGVGNALSQPFNAGDVIAPAIVCTDQDPYCSRRFLGLTPIRVS